MTTATRIRFAYDRVGDGEPALLMLPGWCADRTCFRDLLALTGQHRTCVALDWRGHGPPAPFMPALAGLQDSAQWEQVRGALFEMWTTGVASTAVHAFVDRMGQHGFEMWSRAGREIAAAFDRHPSPVAALAEDPAPFLHIYAQPTEDAYLQAQQDFSAQHPWFGVQRVSGRSHFPNLESPTETAAAIESFVNGL